MKNIAVIGTGSWGTALAIHLANLGNNIKMWSYAKEEIDLINNEKRCKFLKDVILPDNIVAYDNFEEVLSDADYIFHVTPSQVVRSVVKEYKKFAEGKPIIICSKGFEKETMKTLDEVIKDEMPNSKICCLTGPSHAEEVAVQVPTAIVLASDNTDLLYELQDLLMNENFRVYLSKDVRGAELGGTLKNIIAICAGIISGMNLGDNAYAALITRGLVEISRLGTILGGKQETFYGLSCLGDLIVTCSSDLSRNKRAGKLLGQGKSIEETKKEVGMVIEGIENIEVAHELAKKYNIEMPIVNAIYDILYNNLTPQDAVRELMTRRKKFE